MNKIKLCLPMLIIIAVAFLLNGCSSNKVSVNTSTQPVSVKSEKVGLGNDNVHLYKVKVTDHYSCKVIVSYDSNYPVVFFNSCIN